MEHVCTVIPTVAHYLCFSGRASAHDKPNADRDAYIIVYKNAGIVRAEVVV